MHAAGRYQPDEMAGAAGSPQAFDQALQRGRVGDFAACDRVVDAGQILHHQPARADIEMADLGIAHLSRRQADVLSRRAQEGVRTIRPQAIERGRARLPDGVVGGIVAPAPAVEYDRITGRRFCISTLPVLHRCPRASIRRLVWDRGCIVNRWRGRGSLAVPMTVTRLRRACLSCHSAANSARAAGQPCGRT